MHHIKHLKKGGRHGHGAVNAPAAFSRLSKMMTPLFTCPIAYGAEEMPLLTNQVRQQIQTVAALFDYALEQLQNNPTVARELMRGWAGQDMGQEEITATFEQRAEHIHSLADHLRITIPKLDDPDLPPH